MTEDVHAHVAPEPKEAPDAPSERRRDRVREIALHMGQETASQVGDVLIDFAAFKAGVEAYELYKAVHDRRHHSALQDVL